MKVDNVTLPAFLASALINGDTSGLSDEDMKWVHAAEEYAAPGHYVSCDGEPFFAWLCGLPGFTDGADMLEFTILYPDA